MEYLKNWKAWLVLIIVATLAVYLVTLRNEFVWDDTTFITNWTEAHSLKNIPSLIQKSAPQGHLHSFRPLRALLYALSYQFWGDNPAGYHIQAISFHLIATCLVFLVTDKAFKNKLLAALTALFFGLHPVHTEAITFVTASFDLLASILLLLSFYFYLLWNDKQQKYYYYSLLLALLGFLAGELALTLPLLLLAYRLLIAKKAIDSKHFNYLGLYIVYIAARIGLTGSFLGSGQETGNIFVRILTMSKVLLRHIWISIFPYDLNVLPQLLGKFNNDNFDFAQIPLVDIYLLGVILVGVGSLFVIFKYKRKNPLITFALIWFFVSLLPVTNIIPSGVTYAERHVYIASFGFCLILAYGYSELYKKHKDLFWTALFVLVLVYSTLTTKRNLEWQNSFTLWSKTAQQNPNSTSVHINLGLALEKNGQKNIALESYKKALSIDPDNILAKNNLATLYIESKQYDKAEMLLEEAIEFIKDKDPNASPSHDLLINLALAYGGQNENESAIKILEQMLAEKPNESTYFYLLGNLYNKMDKVDMSLQSYKRSIELNPKYYESYNNLGALLAKQKEYDKAKNVLLAAISLRPKDEDAYYNLANVYIELKEYDQAKIALETAIQIKPDFKRAIDKLNDLK